MQYESCATNGEATARLADFVTKPHTRVHYDGIIVHKQLVN